VDEGGLMIGLVTETDLLRAAYLGDVGHPDEPGDQGWNDEAGGE
jgi:hypothetical protein